ncbi:MAG: ATP-binding protein [Candidatus Omnitrophota bacterium]|nr:ATP-binding protein [Candidatus Omnitrophota bacterium]
MSFNPHAIASFVSSAFVLGLGLLVFRKRQHSPERLAFSWLCLTAFVWLFCYGLMKGAVRPEHALLFARLGHSGVIFIPIAYLHFVRYHLKVNWLARVYSVYYVVGVVSLVLMWTTDLYVPAVAAHYWGFYPVGGIVMWIDFIWLVAAVFLTYTIFIVRCREGRRASSLVEFNKLRYGCAALGVFTLAALDFLPKLSTINFYPLGFATTAGFVSITAYAILKHQLMDITIAIRKSLVYSGLIACITATYLVMVLIMEKWFQGFVGYRSVVATSVVAFLIAIFFNPLRNRVQALIDRALFKATPAELATQRDQLLVEVRKSDQMKAVATFAAGMAHEIKNPLTAIKTFTEFLPEKYDDPSFREKFTRIVGQEVGKIDQLVHHLLDFAKPAPPHLQPLQLSALLDETLDLLSNDCLQHRVSVERTYSPNGSTIQADPQQLRQVFLNLFLNSLEAMDGQGGTLTVSTTPQDGHLTVTIADTGPGIPKEHLPHLGEPFFTTKPTGTGLGLSVVQSIIQEHGGRISIDSALNLGTTVCITLPAVNAPISG